ncbi:MAG: hypothetical protein JWQ47_2228 [Glaciihabitans sp.]|nr:hypothetical protein [Glaciihabitans sp.]
MKNVLLVAADVLPAVLFVWSAVWPLDIGALIGGLIGPTVARRVPHWVLRISIASCGVVLAVWLLFTL